MRTGIFLLQSAAGKRSKWLGHGVNVLSATDMSSVAYRLAFGGADGWYWRGWSFGFFIFAPFTPAGRYERLDLAMLQHILVCNVGVPARAVAAVRNVARLLAPM